MSTRPYLYAVVPLRILDRYWREETTLARHVRNPKIESRAARAKLKPSPKPVYFDLGSKLHLGYRRGKGAGAWVARRYLGDERYLTKTLAEADDLADANKVTVLSFDQAQDRARAWASDLDKAERIAALGQVITVRDAIAEYLNERETARDARTKLKHLIADVALAETPLAALTVADLVQWRTGLLDKMAEASARRVANDARACLNFVAKRHRDKLPPLMRDTVRDGFAVSRKVKLENTREKQILTDADIRRLIDAARQIDEEQGWGGDLGRMVVTLASTGARFSQVVRLRVADLQVEHQRLMMPTSRKGGGEKQTSHTAIPLLLEVVDALKRATGGRRGVEPLLLRPHWRRAPGLGQSEVYGRAAWGGASTLTRPWKAIIRRAGLPAGIVPYSFRHSSIVRGLRAGLPSQLVAQLHDTSATMIERYYGRFVSDALHALARAALVSLMPTPVTPIHVVEG